MPAPARPACDTWGQVPASRMSGGLIPIHMPALGVWTQRNKPSAAARAARLGGGRWLKRRPPYRDPVLTALIL